jgi:hypothetical protein
MPEDLIENIEDYTTEEQLRRCREMLAANLCAQGVRALPSEPLTSLITKVSKIDRQQKNVAALQNYAVQLKNFAIANRCDYGLGYVNSVRCNGNTTNDGANVTVGYVYWDVPTVFTFNGASYSVQPKDVVLVSCAYMNSYWGQAASNPIQHYYSYGKTPSVTNGTTFDFLKNVFDTSTTYQSYIYGGTILNKFEITSGKFARYDASQYRLISYPLSTSYDYWYGSGVCYLNYTLWAFKLPALGTSPNNLFPEPPVLPSPEYYY